MKKYMVGAVMAAVLGTGISGVLPPYEVHAAGGWNVPDANRALDNQIIDRDMSTDERMLFVAIDKADYDTIDLMLQRGVDINAFYVQRGATPFGHAMQRGSRDMLQFLIDRGADVRGFVYDRRNRLCLSYLVDAVRRHDLDLVAYLYDWGADINEVSWDWGDGYYNALFLLNGYRPDDLALMQYLIEQGIDVNYQTSRSGRTPLINVAQAWISSERRRPFIELLLNAGAATDMRDAWGRTAVDYCLDRNDLENAQFMQQY